ncbi:HD domain-containing protein [Amycolatopsis sp. cg5]|uniref:HD domain-containing protein n=1 Tax=Amycolatopsis sp. cg5 TaxID=3238802 RepID=UPI003524BBFF
MLVFELDRETQRLMPHDAELITSAATTASFLHREQTRYTRRNLPRVPYIEHPLRVALRLIRWGVDDAELIAAALLHDVAEDCADELLEIFGQTSESALDCLTRLYGARVSDWVGEVTNPGTHGGKVSITYAEHITVLAESGSHALLIKASDLKDNAGSIKHQLGHGQDEKMLRLLGKYLPVVAIVADGLSAVPPSISTATAAAELDKLAITLGQLAVEHGLGG